MTPVVIDPPPSEPVLDEPAVQLAELQAIMDTLREHAQLSETRHREILDGISQCHALIERLMQTAQQLLTLNQAENPQVTQILTQVSEIRGELSRLTPPVIPPPSESNPSSSPVVEPETIPANVPTTPSGQEPPQPPQRRQRRYIRV